MKKHIDELEKMIMEADTVAECRRLYGILQDQMARSFKPLLDALKELKTLALLWEYESHQTIRKADSAIEAAENVEVGE